MRETHRVLGSWPGLPVSETNSLYPAGDFSLFTEVLPLPVFRAFRKKDFLLSLPASFSFAPRPSALPQIQHKPG